MEDIYNKNIDALNKHSTRLVKRLDGVECGQNVFCEKTAKGIWTAYVRTPAGANVPLHSRIDPKAEAKRWAESIKPEKNHVYIVLGAGMGYHIDALLAKIKRSKASCKVLVIEKDIELFKALLLHRDMRRHFRGREVLFSVADDRYEMIDKMRALLSILPDPQLFVLELHQETTLDMDYYEEVSKLVRDEYQWTVTNIGTIVCLSSMWQYNTLKCLPYVLENPGVNALKDVFKGRPAVIVAPGPSLQKNIHLLPQLQDKALIIACGTAVKALYKHGIRPDISVIVDGSHKTYGQFADSDNGDLYLVANAAAYPDCLGLFKDRVFLFSNNNPIMNWIERFSEKGYGTLVAGGTVSVSATDLAIKAGCGPIAFVGLDLSILDDGTEYAKDTYKENQKAVLASGRMRRIPGNYQETVLANEGFIGYRKALENLLRGHSSVRFINATAGGAKIDKTELIPLEKALEVLTSLDAVSYKKILEARHGQGLTEMSFDTEGLSKEVDILVESFKKIEVEANEAAMLCNKIIFQCIGRRKDTVKEVKRCLRRLMEIDRSIMDHEHNISLIDMTVRPVAFAIASQYSAEEKRYSNAIVANRRSRSLYENIEGASIWTRTLIECFSRHIKDICQARMQCAK